MSETTPTTRQSYRTWATWLYGMLLPSLLSILLFVLLIFQVILPSYRNNMMERKKDTIRTLTQAMVSILSDYELLANTKQLSVTEAQAKALDQIRLVRYGSEMKDYFWISDQNAHMVMHPYRSELEDQDLSSFRDLKDKQLFIEFVKAVEHKGGGYVDYYWQWQDDPNRIESKLSYVQLFKPWGWIVGTGIYLDDVNHEITQLSQQLALYASAILIFVIALIGIIVTYSAISEKHHQQAERTIRELNAELEQRVIERTAELEAANEELQAFAYSVSHDLRAPLRSINGFSQALMEDYAGDLAKQATDYLQRVYSASEQMSEQIDDILKLSRMTSAEMSHQTLSLNELSEEILISLQNSEPERHVTWYIESDMQIRGDPKLLRIVMQNLLGNAWKFTSQTEKVFIHVGRTTIEEQTTYYVKDNGAGFDSQYAHRLFGVFQRLHSAKEFPGHGIGLASVKRIIRRHGGRTWAESSPGQGATFFFTLGPSSSIISPPHDSNTSQTTTQRSA